MEASTRDVPPGSPHLAWANALEPEALPWDATSGPDGSVVVVWALGVGLDGHPEGEPEGSESADAGVAGSTTVQHLAAGHLAELGTEHGDWSGARKLKLLWWW